MISGKNIIAIASNWHFDPTSKHHVMRILSEQNNVLWVNYHGSRRPQVSASDARAVFRKLRQVAQGPERISETMLALTPLLLPLPGSATARRLNRALVVRQIRQALRQFPRQPVQLWSFAPDVDYLVGRFDEQLDLYYCVDEFSEFSGYDRETIQRLERRLIERCDIVVTTAGHLQESKSELHSNTHLVTHGVSYDHFARAGDDATNVPRVMRDLRAPVFGFFGMIADWIDLDLIAELARRRPEWSVALIGQSSTSTDVCAALSNVHLLGQVPFDDLPGYCKAFDVGLIPFRINRLTRHVNPIKLREYLAAGLPVVSTDLPEVRRYRPHVHIGRSIDEFEQACEQALQERTPHHRELRQAAVRNETWHDKVEQLSALVDDVLMKPNTALRPQHSHEHHSAAH
jgi:glycosyltransferase involved in cell wall biosynthesis